MIFTINGIDIYINVAINYCVYEMYSEKQSDTLVIKFIDSKGLWSKWNPQNGDEVTFEKDSIKTGKMFIHSATAENGIFTLRCFSMPPSGKNKYSKSWKGVRFLQLAKEIASKHGLSLKTYGCEDQLYSYISQENETDFAFFSNLCMLESCQMIVYDKNMIVYNEAYMEKQTPGKVEIGADGEYSYENKKSIVCGAAEIRSGNFSGKYTVDSKNTKVLLPDTIKTMSNVEATRFAKGLLRNNNKYQIKGKFTKSLTQNYAAASTLKINTLKASEWDGTVFIYKLRNDFVKNSSTIYFRGILEGY